MSQSGRFISGGPSPGSAIEFITGNTGGAVGPTAGNVNLDTANTTVLFAGNPGTSTITQDFGLTNLILGSNPGGITVAAQNVGVGDLVLPALTSGLSNTSVGYLSGNAISSGSSNTFVGFSSGEKITTTNGNTAIGSDALSNVVTGVDNIAIGNNAAISCTTNDSSNIVIGSVGSVGLNNAIVIGTQGSGAGQQNITYVAGINGSSAPVNPIANVIIDTVTNQLSTSNGVVNNWVVVTGPQTLLLNTGHFIEGAGTETVTLPAVAARGTVIRVVSTTQQWIIAQNAGQSILIGIDNTTVGVGGSLASTSLGDCVELVCFTANNGWVAISSFGNLSVT